FLGCSYYAFDVDEAVKKFIVENKENIGKLVCFGTSAMMRSMKKPVGKVAKTVGVTLAQEEFHCRGQFGKIHKGRPNQTDLDGITEFAQRIIIKEGE
ncbi:MAG: flavodoxin, partial [Clostridia bacterium]|nr:flavodoxin [Clostridia bacterium]